MRRITFWNRKGGVGKTTICVHVGYRLGELGSKVAIIDLDTQGNAYMWLSSYQNEGLDKGKAYSLEDENIDLTVLYASGMTKEEIESWIADGDFDYVLYDCPALLKLTDKFGDVDLWIVPIEGRLSIEGAVNVKDEIDLIKGKGQILIVPNKTNARSKVNQTDIDSCNLLGADGVWGSVLPSAETVRRSEHRGKPCWKVRYGSGTNISHALMSLGDWIHRGARFMEGVDLDRYQEQLGIAS
jgi:cellulose biosynthesis protein BcsQ